MDTENTFFQTQKGYDLKKEGKITYAMEDYLEMICRLIGEEGYTRVSDIAKNLHVKTSSASKMTANLKKEGLISYEKYGLIRLTEQGAHLGKYLLHRHDTLHAFLCFINHSANELELTEQIEHYFNEDTIYNIEALLLKMKTLF